MLISNFFTIPDGDKCFLRSLKLKAGFLLTVLAVFTAGPVFSLTLSEIRTDVRLRIKDTNSTRQRFTDAQLLTFANEAQRDVANATWCTYNASSITLVSGTTYYSIPSDVIAIVRVTKDRKVLKETSLNQKDAEASGWEISGGVPSAYFQDPSQTDQIGFAPWPSGSNSTGTVRIIYVALPADMSADGDSPFNSEARFEPYHDLISLYMVYRVYLIEGETNKYQFYRQEYESRLQMMRDRVGSKPNYIPGFSGNQNR